MQQLRQIYILSAMKIDMKIKVLGELQKMAFEDSA